MAVWADKYNNICPRQRLEKKAEDARLLCAGHYERIRPRSEGNNTEKLRRNLSGTSE